MSSAAEEFEELPPGLPAWAELDRITAYRKELLAAGYQPLPAIGKAVKLLNWTTIEITQAVIDSWARERPNEINTGVRTQNTPFVDIDVTDEKVAEEIEAYSKRQ